MNRTTVIKDKVLKLEKVYWRNLKWFQPGDIKKQSKLEKQRLKKSLVENDFSLPFFIWDRGKTGQYILDGHHREAALKELDSEGISIPDLLPALFYDLADEAAAKKLIVIVNAKFADFKKDELLDWVKTDFSGFEDLLTGLNYKQIRDIDFLSFDNEISARIAEQKVEDLIDPNVSTLPICYYGGKQKMFRKVIMHFPVHEHYVEPFVGGGAVFWKKKNSPIDSINDKSKVTANLYYVIKDSKLFSQFQELVGKLCHCEAFYADFIDLIKKNKDKDILSFTSKERVDLAVGFWYGLVISFSSCLDHSFGFAKTKSSKHEDSHAKTFFNKSDLIRASDYFCQKLRHVQVFCRDAVNIIELLDTPQTFFYADPPYFNADMAFYAGYTKQDFEKLLRTLAQIKGHFLMSCYDSETLQKYAKPNKWNIKRYEYEVTSFNRNTSDKAKMKTELLVYNYSKDNFIINN